MIHERIHNHWNWSAAMIWTQSFAFSSLHHHSISSQSFLSQVCPRLTLTPTSNPTRFKHFYHLTSIKWSSVILFMKDFLKWCQMLCTYCAYVRGTRSLYYTVLCSVYCVLYCVCMFVCIFSYSYFSMHNRTNFKSIGAPRWMWTHTK